MNTKRFVRTLVNRKPKIEEIEVDIAGEFVDSWLAKNYEQLANTYFNLPTLSELIQIPT